MNASRYLELALATWCLLHLFNQAHALQVDSCPLDINRLPTEVLPEHYKLDLTFFNTYMPTFDGEVNIDVFEPKPKSFRRLFIRKQRSSLIDSWQIILHAAPELQINSVGFTETEGAKNNEIEVSAICRDPLKSLLKVELARNHESRLTKGRLRFSFTGPIQKEPEGVFDASFDSKLIMTKFEPAMARKAFPCFDEPNFKATFKVSIKLPKELTALSNMEQSSTESLESELQGIKCICFHTTSKMSTHLLAFAVGDFDQVEKQSKDVKLVMWTPPGRAESAMPHLETAVESYEELLEYFQIKQPLKKIDLVGMNVPHGALGNWGMIAFNSTLTADNQHLSPEGLYRLSESVARELARSWFGGLVTVKWWDDKWLNEGFLRWVSRVVLPKILPDYDHQMIYLLTIMMPTLEADTFGRRTHPIKNSKQQTVKEINASFDTVTYNKAECVINMLVNYLGAPVFQEGIRKYISRNLYGNADADELWVALKDLSGINVARLMHSWLYEEGYPTVVVRLSGVKKPYRLSISQKILESFEHPIWIIPIIILIWGGGRSEPTTIKFVLSEREDSIKLPTWFDPARHWLKLNANFEGYYRVQYGDQQLFKALERAVKSKEMAPADRLNVLDEARVVLQVCPEDRSWLQKMIIWYKDEEDDGVIAGLVEMLKALNKIYKKEIDWGDYIMLQYYIKNGRVRDNPQDSYLRVRVRDQVLDYLMHETLYISVREDCYKLYKSLMESGKPIRASLRGAFYASVALIGTEAELEQVLEQIRNIEYKPERVNRTVSIWNLLKRFGVKERFEKFDQRVWALAES